MNFDAPSLDASSLDALCTRAQAGDGRAEGDLFSSLRVRFLQLAKRRVQTDHIEDVVQDALKIVCDRYGERKQGVGILAWSLTVLRNVIGNYYQSRQTERRHMDFVDEYPHQAASRDDPLATTLADESGNLIREAIGELAERFPRCGRIFANLLANLEQGGSPQEVSTRTLNAMQGEIPDLTRGGFYTALHRCRGHLRAIWDQRQGEPNHV